MNTTKYGNRKAEYGGKIYHSTLEAEDAIWLKSLQKEGRISDLKEQVRYRIFHNGDHIVDSIVDFQFVYNGVTVWYETKGMETDKYRVVKRLLMAEMKDKESEIYIVNAKDLMQYMRGRVSHA